MNAQERTNLIRKYWEHMEKDEPEKGFVCKEELFSASFFKYRSLNEYTFDQLENDYLWMSAIEMLNDPFECTIQFDNDQCLREYFSSAKFLESFQAKWNHSITAEELQQIIGAGNPWRKYTEICAAKGLIITLTEEQQLSLMQNKWKDRLTEANHKMKICSFSERKDSLLMWSHYADQHKGICIEYNLQDEHEIRYLLQPVYYREEICGIGLLEEFNTLRHIMSALVKSTDWTYEKEWRITYFKKGEEFADRVSVKPPIAVYLGTRFHQNPPKLQTKLLDLLKRRGITAYRMTTDPHQYRLTDVKIDDQTMQNKDEEADIIFTFKSIREQALDLWLSGLMRTRQENDLSDRYADSKICRVQEGCTTKNQHCSILCSLADWINNVSDLLTDCRYDDLNEESEDILFRYYTRVLLLLSEILEDLVWMHMIALGLDPRHKGRQSASRDLETDMLSQEELKWISDFINSICKHKSEKEKLHMHNHHLYVEFEDFGAVPAANQLALNKLTLDKFDRYTTILMPKLNYFISVVIRVHDKVLDNLINVENYREAIFGVYNRPWEKE